jgi:ABC-2 type transport system ATP-binding protein
VPEGRGDARKETLLSAIRIDSLCRKFGDNIVVSDLTFDVKEFETFTLLGANGAGKTTTMKMLTTLLRPTSGTASILGRDILRETDEVRKLVSLMPQGNALDPFLTANDNIVFFAKLMRLDTGVWKERAEEILAELDIAQCSNQPVLSLSGGQFRRLQLARTLLTNHVVVFLDEPTLGIDIEGKIKVWELIKKYRRENGWTVVLSTNDMAEAEYLSDRIAFLHRGTIGRVGTPAEVKGLLDKQCIYIKYTSCPTNVPTSFVGCSVEQTDDSTIVVHLTGIVSDIRPILQAAGDLGEISQLVTDQPSLTDVFRQVQEEAK